MSNNFIILKYRTIVNLTLLDFRITIEIYRHPRHRGMGKSISQLILIFSDYPYYFH